MKDIKTLFVVVVIMTIIFDLFVQGVVGHYSSLSDAGRTFPKIRYFTYEYT